MRQISENKNSNGKRKRQDDPDIIYRHLTIDVWAKKQKDEDREDVAFSDEIKDQLDAFDSEEE